MRQALGIERWAVAGQSFGGRLALRYAAAHPGHTSAVIFENPVWDMTASARAALLPIAAMLAERGDTEAAQAPSRPPEATVPPAVARGRPEGSAGDEGSMRHHMAIVADPASEEPVQRLGRPARPPAADRRRVTTR